MNERPLTATPPGEVERAKELSRRNDDTGRGHPTMRGQCNPVEQPKETYGFIRDGEPWVWEEAAQDWVPVAKSSRAAAWVAMQRRLFAEALKVTP